MIQNLTFEVYLFISGFLAESLKSNKILQKRSLLSQYSFAQKIFTHSTKLNSLNKKYTPTTQLKTLKFTSQIFQQTCFWLVSEKKLHCTISRRSVTAFWKHLESKYMYIPVFLRKKTFVQLLSGGRLNNFLRVARCCLGRVKHFRIFHFN